MQHCTTCKAVLPDTARFCGTCGGVLALMTINNEVCMKESPAEDQRPSNDDTVRLPVVRKKQKKKPVLASQVPTKSSERESQTAQAAQQEATVAETRQMNEVQPTETDDEILSPVADQPQDGEPVLAASSTSAPVSTEGVLEDRDASISETPTATLSSSSEQEIPEEKTVETHDADEEPTLVASPEIEDDATLLETPAPEAEDEAVVDDVPTQRLSSSSEAAIEDEATLVEVSTPSNTSSEEKPAIEDEATLVETHAPVTSSEVRAENEATQVETPTPTASSAAHVEDEATLIEAPVAQDAKEVVQPAPSSVMSDVIMAEPASEARSADHAEETGKDEARPVATPSSFAPTPLPITEAPKPRKRSGFKWLIVAAVILLVVAGSAGVFAFVQRSQATTTTSLASLPDPLDTPAPTPVLTPCATNTTGQTCSNGTAKGDSSFLVDVTFSGAVTGKMTVNKWITCGPDASPAGGTQYHVAVLGTVGDQQYGLTFEVYPYKGATTYTDSSFSFFGPSGDVTSLTKWRSNPGSNSTITVNSDKKSGTLDIDLNGADHSTVHAHGSWTCG